MSANLKRHGHECHLIFLKRYSMSTSTLDLEVDEYPWLGIDKSGRTFKYAANTAITDVEMQLLVDTLRRIDPRAIGLTVNTPLRTQSALVTKFLKERLDIPILWGGYDPTINATACLEHCDYVCVGEGDQAILDIAARIDAGLSFDDVCNLATTRGGETKWNPRAPLEVDIDKYPWRDNSSEHKYLIDDDRIIENCADINGLPDRVYHALSSRGCPYHCSYCCQSTLHELYEGERVLRQRSAEDFVAELDAAKHQFGLMRIRIDDEIFGMNVKWLRGFVPLYKEKIGLPFSAFIYPCRDTETILSLLQEAGLDYCCLALESGSERINREIYDRVHDRERFLEAARACKKLGVGFYTDVITYCPYEEEEDLEQTLEVLLEIGGGFDLCVNKLFVLPGTALAERMERDGVVISDPTKDKMFDYYVRIFWIASFRGRAKEFIQMIHGAKFFRERPDLLNPGLIEELLRDMDTPPQ